MPNEDKKLKSTVRILLDGKEILYSHQNILAAIDSFLPYITNDDIDDLIKTLTTLKDHGRQKEYLSKLETLKHSWPYPDTKLQPNKEQLEND